MTRQSAALDLMARMFQRVLWLDDGLQQRLHDRGWPDVSRAQSLVMLNVIAGITRPAEIARRVGVSRQAVHVTIAQMVELGILKLEADPDDARHKRVAITPFGETMRHAAQDSMGDLLGTLADRIGQDRLEALLDALRTDWGPSR
jgi:DNA-binding MarR family transcriptional regulator